MKVTASCALLLTLFLEGCGNDSSPQPPPPPPPLKTNYPTSSGGPSQTSGRNPTPASAPAQYIANLSSAELYARITADTASINQAIQVFNANEGRFPKNLNELVETKYMGHIPNPPRGMKFYYNPDNGEFKILEGP